MNQLLRFKSLRLLPLTAIALLLGHFSAFAGSNTNTSLGLGALPGNTKGVNDTGVGYQALHVNSTGNDNTATGAGALANNISGNDNTATGARALASLIQGFNNTATGKESLASNTMGFGNTATGDHTLFANTMGANNTAIGRDALQNCTTGSNNIAVGSLAGNFLNTGDNNIDIGSQGGVSSEANTIRIGDETVQTACFIAGIFGQTAPMGLAVYVDTNGKLGTVTSSARFKDEIKPMDKASEALFALEPVTFRYKKEIDPDSTPQFGLVAEDVEKVNPDLVVRDKDGKPYSVRYDQVNAMLLNEFLKEHHEMQELKKQVAALTAGLQKVSAQFFTASPVSKFALGRIRRGGRARQTVLNDQ